MGVSLPPPPPPPSWEACPFNAQKGGHVHRRLLHGSELLGLRLLTTLIKATYCMASSVRGQDESNPVLWLATWVGKRAILPYGVTCSVPQENFTESRMINQSFIGQACSVKMAWQRPCSLFVSPAILTSHLINNPRHTMYINLHQLHAAPAPRMKSLEAD